MFTSGDIFWLQNESSGPPLNAYASSEVVPTSPKHHPWIMVATFLVVKAANIETKASRDHQGGYQLTKHELSDIQRGKDSRARYYNGNEYIDISIFDKLYYDVVDSAPSSTSRVNFGSTTKSKQGFSCLY
ncbi:hypothetical protein L2E82_01520 [Cichorium intybus]|uniref:Uncharacterized protein n=1 Tax=Cichorium intybus TaxID=13427 RepID=A0ACB9H086_CICIN|nr:hypothetical protein L2E82_01520 [Cichorium intybus]